MITEQELYYKTRIAMVRDSQISDVFNLAQDMREADKKEVWRSHHRKPEEALLTGFSNSVLCLTIERNEKPIGMFGIVPMTLMGRYATIWMLASPELEDIQRTFVKYSRYFIKMFLNYYPILLNWVDADNHQSKKWLKWCGAEFGPVAPYGEEQCPFQYFQFTRKKGVK